ncbi:BrnT family toxin [Aureimonas fodinaquatilis]|uniref:BrnT family toxin n=1 Tax=Aureimonas fodinaquatilis TaxID=2565783 RepID=A0A5B0DVQ8_9HYPH|nr:BrnT family toxin [Aureimonas fodinaquatilis]
MRIEFDRAKCDKNIAERGLSFSQVADFDWSSVQVVQDTRYEYPEPRFVGIGFIGDRIHVVCYTPVSGGIRIISFRKANAREVKRYEKTFDE